MIASINSLQVASNSSYAGIISDLEVDHNEDDR